MPSTYKDYILGPAMAVSRFMTVSPALARCIRSDMKMIVDTRARIGPQYRGAYYPPLYVQLVDAFFGDVDRFLKSTWDEARIPEAARHNPLDHTKKAY